METIGLITGNKVELGATGNGFVYKNREAFQKKSDQICYIPEYGVEDGEITEESSVYTFQSFLDLAEEYIAENDLEQHPEKLAEQLFDLVDWQHPETLLEEWDIHSIV